MATPAVGAPIAEAVQQGAWQTYPDALEMQGEHGLQFAVFRGREEHQRTLHVANQRPHVLGVGAAQAEDRDGNPP